MKGLLLALSFLTSIPVRLKEAPQPGDLGRSAAWFSLIGALIGGLAALARFGFGQIFPDPLASVLAVGLWIWLSGALHLDGLADCCDGLLNASSPERRLEIMRDPRVGTFGAVGLALAILLKLGAVMAIRGGWLWVALPLAGAVGRWLILWAGKQPLARPGGMGADFSQGLSRSGFLLCGILPALLAVLADWKGVLGLTLAGLAAFGIFCLAKSRLGGVTGDVFGLTVEVGEIVVLLSMAIKG